MRPPATIAFTLTGLVLFAVAALALVPEGEPEHEAEPAAVEPAPARLASREPKLPEGPPREQTSSIRRIAPSVVAVPPFQPRGLTREPPRRAVASLAPEPQKPEFTKFFRPVASAAGRMRIDGREIEIAGIRILEPNKVCDAADGSTWPCGMRARTAFRAWLRGRAVDCRLGSAEVDEVLTTDCRLGGDDIGRWLVENGWATAVADGPYAEAGKHAEDEALGIFARK